MEPDKFEKKYLIPVYDTAPDGKLSLYSLFNYLQDIASEHAVRLKFGRDDLMKANRFWVLSRIVADVYIRPVWEETIIVKTWPRGTDTIFAIRDYEVSYPDGRKIAAGSSSWLIVDMTTRKVQRPDEMLTRFNSGKSVPNALGRNAGKVSPVSDNCQVNESFRVKLSDLDVNLHTNNVNYIKWVTDTYDLDFLMNHSADSIEVNYLAESKIGEEILIRSEKSEHNDIFHHSVIRKSDEKELSRMRIEWKDCSQQKVY
jgi:medium-chain acyl-[acyl-carrier-protein] hydrolase